MLSPLLPSANSSRNALLSAMRPLSTAVARQPGSRPSVAADLPRGYEYTIQKKLVKSLRRGGDESLLSARGFCRNLTEILPERPPNIRLVRELLGELAHSPEFVKANRDAVDGLCAVLRGRIDEDSLSRIQGRALGEIAQSIGRLELPWAAEMTLIARHCQDRLGLESMPAAAVANVAYGVAKCGGTDAGFVAALASDWLRRIRNAGEPIQPASHIVVMRSLGYMFDGQPCVVGLLQEFTRRVYMSAFNDHQKSQIVGAQTRILRGPNTPQPGADIGHVDATEVGLVDLATLVTAHAKRQKALPEDVITRIISLLEDQEQDFDPQLLANLSRAVGSLLGCHSTASRGLDHLLESLNNTVVKCPEPLPLPVLGSVLWASLAGPSPKVKRLASVLLTKVDRDALSTARPQVQAPILSGIVGLGLSQDFPRLVSCIAEVRGLKAEWTDADVRGVSKLVGPLSRVPGTQARVVAIADWVGSRAEHLTPQVAGSILRGIANATSPRQVLSEFPEAALRFADAVASRWGQVGASDVDLADLASIVWALATLRLSHYELQEKCCSLAARVLRQRSTTSDYSHLPVFLWAVASNSHRTEAARGVLRQVMGERVMAELPDNDLPVLVWSMAVLNLFDETFLRDVLARCATVSLQSAALIRLYRAVEWATAQHNFRLRGQTEVDLAARAAAEATSSALPVSSSFQDEVLRELVPLVSDLYPRWEVVSEYDLSSDVPGVVCDLALVDKTTRQPKLLIEADGAAHFVHCVESDGSRRLGQDGKTELLRRIVRLRGYQLLSIDTNSWKSTLRPNRRELLRREITATLKGEEAVFLKPVSA
ncbi:hypothetical protein FOZ61_003835 [Perkinsus olseni]|uniref:RAP domain-containing protein n=1 Tax=Perkinsus olseni TaxID=32597 RepID=A0A7J6LN38_PEROL|nr:hypothetical protein FOZ61_003835 [Perkinsus olseni]